MNTPILEVKNLTKNFGGFIAVNDVSFQLKEGEILGFLGPNGAGKTTTIQMLLTLLKPTSGKIEYFGKDLFRNREEILQKINFSSTYTNLPWYFTVKENLTWISYLYDIKNRKSRVEKMIAAFKLEEIMHKSVGQLSAGQITRVNLAKSFLNYPKVLLLDEPTASLDPDVASYIREFIEQERKEFNVSIIITSHNMAEVEELCDRVIFINHGKIIANDTPQNLARTIEVSHIELLVDRGMEKLKTYCTENKLDFITKTKSHIIITVNEKAIAKVLRELSERSITYNEISIEKPTLEDYFLQMSLMKGTHETQ
jgi:ABC-2 type transport system ATP-binding protein